jgi:Hypoxia induced protein conserved region
MQTILAQDRRWCRQTAGNPACFCFPPDPGYKAPMANFLSHGLVPIAIGAVAIVLLLGLINMMRGGSGNTSQKLMRLRVVLQFVAIVIIMVTIWVMAK